ncbi:tryptophan halogenase family protein [Colwellia sp. Bg11-28]|uniref:tryptophan halogenase family protein n=1 Tax=Colwellia sp. Bg11-28 TaxID=2058305 RepID=UPI000C34802E|nr:tryptophan halogenase family protein [Colwellia sp. Bg11-28]PKH86679.1 tryptophan halogenase [Colwellia sp. Bg11-28]
MGKAIKKIVIVGGGSAGWITAGSLAAEHCVNAASSIEVILIESPEVNSIGVGEGTWPSMRNTLEKIGIDEKEFLQQCDASFKQGSKFIGWTTGDDTDSYYHPFMTPDGYGHIDLHAAWQANHSEQAFADAVNIQSHVCQAGLAPKQLATPSYAAVTNYGYHLDAKKFASLLHKHCTQKLNVQHIVDHMDGIISADNGDINAISTKEHGHIAGDLFIDCTGSASLLLGKHFNIGFINKQHILFNDSALAVQVPYPDQVNPINSATLSTAQSAGWIWDIGLQTRRGVGYTYSSQYISDAEAEKSLRQYLVNSVGEEQANLLKPKKLIFEPGHREKFWHKNCVAIGMSAGFLEPLEASALAMVELSSTMVSEELPVTRAHMDIIAKRFNERFNYRWQRIIDFLKLHYILSKRTDSHYWRDNQQPNSISEELQELIKLWQYQPPSRYDFVQNEEVFPSASYQYVLYGMGFETEQRANPRKFEANPLAEKTIAETQKKIDKYLTGLPTNRELLNKLKEK